MLPSSIFFEWKMRNVIASIGENGALIVDNQFPEMPLHIIFQHNNQTIKKPLWRRGKSHCGYYRPKNLSYGTAPAGRKHTQGYPDSLSRNRNKGVPIDINAFHIVGLEKYDYLE